MYAPLRAHGHHSLLTGVDTPASLLERARELGLGSLALCDVDGIGGLVDFLRAAERMRRADPEHAVRPIVAAELSDPAGPGRLIALVRTRQGYANLCRIITERQLGAPLGEEDSERFDLPTCAARHSEGLFLLADHPRLLLALFGRVPARQLFAAISPAGLRKRSLATPADALDASKCPPPAAPFDASEMIEAARAVGVATLAVPDVYYARPEGRESHRVRVAIKHNALLCDLPESWLASEPAHLPGAPELRAALAGLPDVPDVPGPWKSSGDMLARTLAVAAECTYTPPLDQVFFPEIELEANETPYSKLCRLAFEGASARYRPMRPEVVRRLDYELEAIESLGFAPYFLLVRQIA